MTEDGSSFDAQAVPCPRQGAEVSSMPLSAIEGFVLSRIDGVLTFSEVVATCGLPEAEGERVVRKLLDLGAIDLLEAAGPEEAPPSAGAASAGGVKGGGTGKDATPALRGRIEEMLERGESSNYYELLGVPPDADRSDIRAAYFALSREFHPDTYYGKDLGPWRSRMEAVFGRLTDAYEILSKKKKRERYDEYIADQIAAWEMEKRLAQVPSLVLYRPRAQGQAGTPVPSPSPYTPAPGPVPAPLPAGLRPESELHRRLKEQKKKRALEALLKVTGKPGAGRKAEPAVQQFKSMNAEQRLAIQYAVAGAEALDRREFMTALNYFELALQITPDDPKVHEAVDRAREEAGAALSDTFEKQGAYEEEIGQHLRAAQSLSKALDVRKRDHALMERVALNLLWGGGNLKRAEELARKARELAPENVDYRATLGEILLKKGAAAEASRELGEARRLEPGNERVARLLDRGPLRR